MLHFSKRVAARLWAEFDPDSLDRRDEGIIVALLPLLRWFDRHYLRLRWDGAENIPTGPALFVANHNGGIMGPDLFCTLAVLWETLGPRTPLYALAHDFAMREFTPLGRLLQLVGAIRATPANAEGVLRGGGRVLVYPGGDLDAYRHFARRNEVVILPRTGFVKIAQSTGVPIVPVVAWGAHRSAIIFSDGERLAARLQLRRFTRTKRFPMALALPWILAPGPWLPYLPLPFPIRLRILPPITIDPKQDALAGAREVQRRMQAALDELGA